MNNSKHIELFFSAATQVRPVTPDFLYRVLSPVSILSGPYLTIPVA